MRLRSWNPNSLNWPSYINTKLGNGLTSIIADRKAKGQLPAQFEQYVTTKAKDFPTIRSICMARPGWCIVEADYKTAEMRGLAFISEDRALKKLILEPDENFGLPKPECIPEGVDAEDCVVRLSFPKYVEYPTDKEKFIMTYTAENELKAKFTEDQLQRDENGNLKHPGQDLHWQICELSRHAARETMNKKKDRGAAKTTNFSASYGGTATSIARKIEADTGNKISADEAQALLDAVDARQPRATIFFHELERAPLEKPFLVAASGRKRHLLTLQKLEGRQNSRVREDSVVSLGRECRNFPMQESVGASAAIACKRLVDFSHRFKSTNNLQGELVVCLYDSCVVHCPVNERHIWQKALDLYMNWSNGWRYGDDILRYPTDCELNAGWSTKAKGEFKEHLHDPDWEPTPENLKPVEEYLDAAIATYKEFPELSVYNK